MSIVGKVALITGAASGIGFGLTKELLKNEAKAVALVDIDENLGKQVLESIHNDFGPNKAIFIKADVSEEKELENAFAKTVETFNQLDLVFNNAGICNERDFLNVLKINLYGVLNGTFLAMTKYLPKYKTGKEGIIINTASIAGLEPLFYIPSYSASKSGVVSLGRSFGHKAYYEKYQVKVLTICPGAVLTPLFSRSKANQDNMVLLPEAAEEYMKIFTDQETPESLAQKVLKIIEKGSSGSIWEIQKNQPLKEIAF